MLLRSVDERVLPSWAREVVVLGLLADGLGICASRCIVPGVLVVPIVPVVPVVPVEGRVVDGLLVDGVVPDVPGMVMLVVLVPVCASIGRAGTVCANANEAAPAIEAAATVAINNLLEFIRFSNSDFSEQTALRRREPSLMNAPCRSCGMSGRSGVGHDITFKRP